MTTPLSEIWYTRCPVPTPVGLAAQLGYLEKTFADVGVALKSIIDSPDRAIRQSHFNHTLEWSFRHGGNAAHSGSLRRPEHPAITTESVRFSLNHTLCLR